VESLGHGDRLTFLFDSVGSAELQAAMIQYHAADQHRSLFRKGGARSGSIRVWPLSSVSSLPFPSGVCG